MKRVIGVWLLVVIALAVTAATASARLPEWGKCKPTESGKGGRYADPGCTVKTPAKGSRSGGYEWTPLGEEFQLRPMSLVGTLTFETKAGKKIQCTTLESESHAMAVGPRGARTPLWELDGCTSEGRECDSQLSFHKGEINDLYAWFEEPAEEGDPVPGWEGQLGFVEGKGGPSPVVGLAYTIKNHERLFEPVICLGPIGTVWLGGERKGGNAFIGAISPVDQMTGEFTETLSQSAPGIQNPTKFQGHKPAVIYAFLEDHWEPVAITATFQYLAEEGEADLEIKAMP